MLARKFQGMEKLFILLFLLYEIEWKSMIRIFSYMNIVW